MELKEVTQIKPVAEMKSFTEHKCNICMEERLNILNKLRDKNVTLMKKDSEIYGAFWHKTTFHQFFLSADDTVNE